MARADFERWLEEHRSHFKNYEAWEIARMAVLCGFSMAEIAPQTSEWVTFSRRRLRLWESPFYEKWVKLTAHQQGRD